MRRPASSSRSAMRAVDDLVADLHPDPAEDLGVHVEVEVHLAAVELREGGAEALLLRVAQRDRRGDDGDHAVPALGGELGQGLESRFQATSTRRGHKARHQTLGGRVGAAAEQAAQQLALGRGAGGTVGQRGPQLGVRGDDPAEPEQLVLDVVERARLLRGGEVGDVRQLLAARPPGRGTATSGSAPVPATRSAAGPPTWPPRRRPASSALASPDCAGSVRTRRSDTSRSSSAVTAASSSASCAASTDVESVSASRRSRAAARASRLAPFIVERLGLLLELVEEAVDDTALPGVVLEGLTDELAGQVGGELAHVLAQRLTRRPCGRPRAGRGRRR